MTTKVVMRQREIPQKVLKLMRTIVENVEYEEYLSLPYPQTATSVTKEQWFKAQSARHKKRKLPIERGFLLLVGAKAKITPSKIIKGNPVAIFMGEARRQAKWYDRTEILGDYHSHINQFPIPTPMDLEIFLGESSEISFFSSSMVQEFSAVGGIYNGNPVVLFFARKSEKTYKSWFTVGVLMYTWILDQLRSEDRVVFQHESEDPWSESKTKVTVLSRFDFEGGWNYAALWVLYRILQRYFDIELIDLRTLRPIYLPPPPNLRDVFGILSDIITAHLDLLKEEQEGGVRDELDNFSQESVHPFVLFFLESFLERLENLDLKRYHFCNYIIEE